MVALLVLAISAAALQAPDAAYLQSFEKWKAELVDDLKQNWLVLAGLFWLKPGANRFGSGGDNAIVLRSGPARAGTFQLRGDDVSVELQPGVDAKIGGQSQRAAKLQADVSGRPTVIEMGSLRMYVIKRGPRLGIRVKDLNSEAVRRYAGPIFFPLNLGYRVSGSFVPSDGKKTVDVPNVLGDVTPTPVSGEVHFKLNGQELTLTALGGDPRKGLSFVIGDLTSKTDTYPGGRFLDSDPVVDGKVVSISIVLTTRLARLPPTRHVRLRRRKTGCRWRLQRVRSTSASRGITDSGPRPQPSACDRVQESFAFATRHHS